LAYSIGQFDIRPASRSHRALRHGDAHPVLAAIPARGKLLFALALAGSVAGLVLMALAGNRIFGGDAGFWAALLFVFHPVFWHASLISACGFNRRCSLWRWEWRAGGPGKAKRDGSCGARWCWASDRACGPEAGPVLLPLWAVCAWRAPIPWRERWKALGRDGSRCTAVAAASDVRFGRSVRVREDEPGLH
jgi:hypothetical protein